MSLDQGTSINPDEIETIFKGSFASEFVPICNDIIWGLSKLTCKSIPSFTARSNAKDYGIDAEWDVNVFDVECRSPVLTLGWNVFQFKQRDFFAQKRSKIVSKLAEDLEGAVKKLFETTGHRPNNYVLFVNIDLTHPTKGQKGRLKECILSDYDERHSCVVKIVGAAEIATFLNGLPHIRLSRFPNTDFITWDEAWGEYTNEKLYDTRVEQTDLREKLDDLRSMIFYPEIRAIVVSGPPDVGKYRLVLEATKTQKMQTIVARYPKSVVLKDLSPLESPDSDVIVIIEDPDLDKAEEFVKGSLRHKKGPKILLTLSKEKRELNVKEDPRVKYIEIPASSESQAQKLLNATEAKLGDEERARMIQLADGDLNILRTVANLKDRLGKEAAQVGRELLDDNIERLKLLSLLTRIGVKKEAYKEIELVCTVFGNGLQPDSILKDIPLWKKAGLVRRDGLYVEVLPQTLANKLTRSLLSGHFPQLLYFFNKLNQSGKTRLINRLKAFRSEETDRFWDELFSQEGLFKDLQSALTESYLLYSVAGAAPIRVMRLIDDGLRGTSVDQRKLIKSELVWTLQELKFYRKITTTALRCLELLAEAETEEWDNYATDVFCECFYPNHPQLPLSLNARFEILSELFSTKSSVELRLIGIKAIKCGLGLDREVVHFSTSSRIESFNPAPEITSAGFVDYIKNLNDLLMQIAQTEEFVLAKSALELLPQASVKWAAQVLRLKPSEARLKTLFAQLETLVEWTKADKPISVSNLEDALKQIDDMFNEDIKRDERY